MASGLVRKQSRVAGELLCRRCLLPGPGYSRRCKGKSELLLYFRKLLANNPHWVWTQIEGIPLEDGFLNKWLAKIPVGSVTLEIVGVCLVQLDGAGKIRRNEVYFDRTQLLAEISRLRQPGAREK